MNDIDIITKWLSTHTTKTNAQQPHRTPHRPVQWAERHYGYLLYRYDTSLDSLGDEIAWTMGRRIDTRTLHETMTKHGHEFVAIDTAYVCVTIKYERRRLTI